MNRFIEILLNPSSFDWSDPDLPLSSFYYLSLSSIGYVSFVILATTVSRKYCRKNHEKEFYANNGNGWDPWFMNSDLSSVQFIHNVNLVISSAIMLGGVVVESLKRLDLESQVGSDKSGVSFLICEHDIGTSASGSLYYWSYIYYLSKYYELFDTLLQLARGKPPPHFVLHVYHHALVMFMAWFWVETKQSLQFIGLGFNTAVHVVMYTYFLQRTITKRVPRWKRFVTLFQIFQFCTSFFLIFVLFYKVLVEKQECAGMGAVVGNAIFNLTLLDQFIAVFKKGRKASKKKT
uniref:Elongation of fatty acids protein n=1 Tax=Eucampia antarctica TaxID=49252 RepID=A0A7S2RD82_9STRA